MPKQITGRKIELDAGRSVFVGGCAGEEKHFLEFRNGNTYSRFTISPEAGDALRSLMMDQDGKYGDPAEFEISDEPVSHWQLVKEIDA